MKAFETTVIAYDPFATAESARRMGVELVSLDEIYRRSDFITIHVPLNSDTRGMIGAAQLQSMKDGVRIINCARGGIVDESALAEAIRSGKVGGAAFDVFGKEPPEPDNPLLSLAENVITPHLGASTEEAQVNVAIDISEQIADVLQGKPARSAVNLPSVSADEMARVAPFIVLASKIGSLHTQLARDTSGVGRPIENVEVIFSGDFAGLPTESITRAALQGLLTPVLDEPVNLVNAPVLAEQRGLNVQESHSRTSPDHSCLLSIRVRFPGGERTICGTVYGQEPRIVHIDGYRVDIQPYGHMIVTQHHDQPGIIGNVGMLLGSNNVNIAGMHVGRESTGGRAIMVLLIDESISDDLMRQIRALPSPAWRLPSRSRCSISASDAESAHCQAAGFCFAASYSSLPWRSVRNQMCLRHAAVSATSTPHSIIRLPSCVAMLCRTMVPRILSSSNPDGGYRMISSPHGTAAGMRSRNPSRLRS